MTAAIQKKGRKPLQVNPVKMSQPMGATLAFMGVNGCLPLMHGAIGCASFTKVFMTRHFCEPIAIRNTAVTEIATILDGGDRSVGEAIQNFLPRVTPEIIGLFSTGLTDARGDDLKGIASQIDFPIVWADTPDYIGGMESGWAKVATAFIEQAVEPSTVIDARKVLLLPHVSIQPLEVEGLKDMLASFGLEVHALPDLSTSMDGHFGENQAAMCQGGISLDDIRALGSSGIVISIGASMKEAGERFAALHPRTKHLHVAGIMGLQATDALIEQVMHLTGAAPDARTQRWRQRLQDAMIDAHFTIGKTRFILAGEPDRIADMAQALTEVGGSVLAAVGSTNSASLQDLPAQQVLVGDLEDVEGLLSEADVLICNLHGHRIAQAHNKIHIPRGYPLYDQIGVQMKVDTLYQGGAMFLIDVANALVEDRMRKHLH